MTEKEAIKQLKNIAKELQKNEQFWDNEEVHEKADEILAQFIREQGHAKLADEFEQMREDWPFWYA